MWERHKAVAHNLSTLNHVDECVRVDAAQVQLQLHQVGTVEVGVNHLTLLTFEQALSDEACSTSIQIIDNEIFNKRPEQLSVAEFVELVRLLDKQ